MRVPLKIIAVLAGATIACAAAAGAARPEIVAHRGASAVAPENTVAAFKLAWELGADAAETDLYLTKDQQVVAIHDKTTKRTTGVEGAIKDMTLAQIRALDAGSLKSPKYAGEKIPTLAEVLATIPQGKHFYLEIKDTKEIVPFLKTIIEESGKQDCIVLIAFNKETLAAAHAAMPGIPTKWLLDAPTDEQKKPLPISQARVAEAKAAGFDGLDVNYAGVDAALLAAAKEAGAPLAVWTLDNPAEAKRLAGLGVTSITTNVPDVLLKAFAEADGEPLK